MSNIHHYTILDDTLVITKEDIHTKIAIDKGELEPVYTLEAMVDIAELLAYIRKEDPALYMKGVTTDMIREYT